MSIVVSGCASDDEKKQSHFEKGQTYFDNGEYKSAELEFKNAVQIDPRFLDAHLRLAETYMKMGDAQETFRS